MAIFEKNVLTYIFHLVEVGWMWSPVDAVAVKTEITYAKKPRQLHLPPQLVSLGLSVAVVHVLSITSKSRKSL
jgi:hypothetical protein